MANIRGYISPPTGLNPRGINVHVPYNIQLDQVISCDYAGYDGNHCKFGYRKGKMRLRMSRSFFYKRDAASRSDDHTKSRLLQVHIRSLTDKKKMKESLAKSSNNNRLCVTVVGSSAVGKTALTVQYLTSRFIGDYSSGTDMNYQHSFSYMGGSLKTNVDIVDISRPSDVIEEGEWSDHGKEKSIAFLVVYSLTNCKSFERACEILCRLPSNSPKYLVANQLDLQHRRQVSRLDGQSVADQFGCPFDEFSAAEPLYEGQQCGVKLAFQKLIRQLISNSHSLPYPRMIRFSAFSKMIGAIVSKTSPKRHQNKLQPQKSLPHHNRKSSMSSCSDRSSSSSSGNNSTGSVNSISAMPDMSLLRIDSAHLMYGVKSKPIPIARREVLMSYSSIEIASI